MCPSAAATVACGYCIPIVDHLERRSDFATPRKSSNRLAQAIPDAALGGIKLHGMNRDWRASFAQFALLRARGEYPDQPAWSSYGYSAPLPRVTG
jgi:hypothetical protein